MNENLITAVATSKARRLLVPTASMRRLASSWDVAFTVKAPSADKAFINTQMEALKQDTAAFQAEMGQQLEAAGVSSTIANSLAVQTFFAQETSQDTSEDGSTIPMVQLSQVESETSNSHGISSKLAIAMAFVVAHLASPQEKPFGWARSEQSAGRED